MLKTLIAFTNDIQALGRRHLESGDYVQFKVDKDGNHAINITGGGGKPILIQSGDYGKYLGERINLPVDQELLEECPVTNSEVTGFISHYDSVKQNGSIEVIAPKGKRYRKVTFSLNDAILPNGVDKQSFKLLSGESVKFKIAVNNNPEEKTIKQKALHITSVDSKTLKASIVKSKVKKQLKLKSKPKATTTKAKPKPIASTEKKKIKVQEKSTKDSKKQLTTQDTRGRKQEKVKSY